MHGLCCISPVPLERESRPLSVPKQTAIITSTMDQQSNYKALKPGHQLQVKNGPASPLMSKSLSGHTSPFPEYMLDHEDSMKNSRSAAPVTFADGSVKVGLSGELNVVSMEARGGTNSTTNAAGILFKWVNYGKGWRPRWFVLQEGVLSYYKVHGPDKVSVNHERHKGLRLIGEEAQRLQRKQRNANVDEKRPRKAFGEVHLKVSSLRESKSEDKKFYIYTGTKTLHLKAESKEDKVAWLDALQAAKDLFPRNTLIYGLAQSFEEIHISTQKLKAHLLLKGLSEQDVGECEEIVNTEFSEVKEKFQLLQQRQKNLLERLRLLEAEKVELETTVVDEMQSQGKDGHNGLKYHGGSDTETDDDDQGLEGDTDEEDEIFFDTKETLGAYRSNSSDLSEHSENDESSDIEQVGFNCPKVKRRTKLPDPKEKEKSISLWAMIKDNIGKDLTKVCLPVYFNEPISSLQKCMEDLEYSYLLDRAQQHGKQGNSLLRLLQVAAFAVSGYASTENRTCKPFNPLLGETYEADFPDKGLRFCSEKVSHHPMIVACHCEGAGWRFWGDSNLKSKFWGRSIQLDPVGVLTLQFEDGEQFKWSKVTSSIYNLILGKLYVDHYGTMRIVGNQELSCKLKFKEQSLIDRNPHQVQGYVHNKSGEKLATLFGKWDESMYYILGDLSSKPKHYDPMSEAVLLWRRSPPAEFPTRYGFTSFAITLNELTPGLKELLPPTDSRLRPDQRHLENGEYEAANAEKLRLEQKQRRATALQEKGWQPTWFRKEKGQETFQYIGGYWEAREEGNWGDCLNIYGQDVPETPAE
ncbi:unnamed protein product [Calypogeia fissa]